MGPVRVHRHNGHEDDEATPDERAPSCPWSLAFLAVLLTPEKKKARIAPGLLYFDVSEGT